MPQPLTFDVHARSASTRARVGLVTTPHGTFRTPAFMPVGTRGSVKGIFPAHVRSTGADILLNNTYHMMLRPGSPLVARMGGVHRFMNWDGPILTDSGGYQAFSLADTNRVDDDGVTFKSIVDGSTIRMAPEDAMRIQNELGADIIMAFDDCPPPVGEQAVATEGASDPAQRGRVSAAIRRDGVGTAIDHAKRLDIANERTVRWLERCKSSHARPHDQALFGIVQGGTDPDRRRWSAERITNIDLPGYAIGGVAVGETSADIARVVTLTAPLLPDAKPRYLMGVGYERDIVAAVRAGVDMFDCVLPTRNGRNANAFTPQGQVRLRNAKFAEDPRPIDPACDCPACAPAPNGGVFSRGYLRHLFMAGEMLGPILVSLHNLRHFQRLMADLRQTIASDDWAALAQRWPVIVGDSGPDPA